MALFLECRLKCAQKVLDKSDIVREGGLSPVVLPLAILPELGGLHMSDLPDVLREYRVKIIPAAVAKAQRDYVEDLGLRTKFGGTPDAIQSGDDFPAECVECGGKLHFVAQLDSFEFKSEDNPNRKDYGDAQFMFGDVGLIYVWFCFDCCTPTARFQCS